MTILLVSDTVLFIIFLLNTCKRFIFNYVTQNDGEDCRMCGIVLMVSLFCFVLFYYLSHSFFIISQIYILYMNNMYTKSLLYYKISFFKDI